MMLEMAKVVSNVLFIGITCFPPTFFCFVAGSMLLRLGPQQLGNLRFLNFNIEIDVECL